MKYANNFFFLIILSLVAVMNCSLFFSYSLLAQEGKIIMHEGPSGAGCSTIAKMLRNKIPHAVLMDDETMFLWVINKIFAQFNLPNQDSLESCYNLTEGLDESIMNNIDKVVNSWSIDQVHAEYFSIIRSFVMRGLTVIIERDHGDRDYFNRQTLGIKKKRILLHASLPVLVERIRCFLAAPSSFEKIMRSLLSPFISYKNLFIPATLSGDPNKTILSAINFLAIKKLMDEIDDQIDCSAGSCDMEVLDECGLCNDIAALAHSFKEHFLLDQEQSDVPIVSVLTYDLCINTECYTPAETVDQVVDYLNSKF